jgi:hydrogenase maturation protease
MKTIILGVGNQILGDDGVGVHISNELKKYIKNPNVTIEEAVTGGMNLLDLILGYDKAIILDAVKSEKDKHGIVQRIPINDFKAMHSCNPHDVSLIEAIEIAKKMGENRIPKEIVIIGVMMKHMSLEFNDKLSKKIAAAIPIAVKMTLDEIKNDKKISS